MEKIYEIFYDLTAHNVVAEPTQKLSKLDDVTVLVGFCKVIADVIISLGEMGYNIDDSIQVVVSTIEGCVGCAPDYFS